MLMKNYKKLLALLLVVVMGLTACGTKPSANTSEKTSESTSVKESEKVESESKPVDKEDLPLLSLFPKDAALFSGLVTGHRSDFFAENGFQLEVWAYSDEKMNAILTSGDLPDLMYVGAGGVDTLETLIETDKIINYEEYKEYLPNFFENPYCEYVEENIQTIRDKWSAGTGGLYILPWALGDNNGVFAQVGTFDRNVPKLKWDVYEAIGAPEITDMWSLLDVAEEMLKHQPTLEDGTQMYGMFLDNGQDTKHWGCMYLWFAWHGYQTSAPYFVEVNKVEGTMKSIFDDDSVYKEGAKWYNEAYRRGLIDPDSISTSRTDQAPKLDNGFAMLPAGTLPGWQTKYYEVFPNDVVVYRDFTSETMNNCNNCIVINKDTEYLEECLTFVNMLADPYSWMRINYGPEGEIWQVDGNVLSITEKFADWLKENGNINFFPMSDGTEWSTWNTSQPVATGVPIPGYVDINGNELCYVPTSWPDAQAIMNSNANWDAWQVTMGATDLWDYCEQHDITVHTSSPFDGVAAPKTDDAMTLTTSTIKDVVVAGTWKCVYAESEEEFDKIWNQMVEDAMGLGAQGVIDWYMEAYKPNK